MLQFASAAEDRDKIVSALVSIETRSGIRRLRRDNLLMVEQTSVALNSFAAEMRRVIEQPVTSLVLETACGLVDRHTLRALDAVQLGSAMIYCGLKSSFEMRFISSDLRLLAAAHEEGFATWNPTVSD